MKTDNEIIKDMELIASRYDHDALKQRIKQALKAQRLEIDKEIYEIFARLHGGIHPKCKWCDIHRELRERLVDLPSRDA